ncbi:SulP family inorganic anion transporter [Vitiosangium sp. GDMCC 1.1324]|uniref:SulP family inorganic anion transporter n=1 Tax=Vitiosangium sp. (strain GDMCC 1.1324) TaxID=2138576 RepID=UPI000D3A660E|nr:SulP family inorganic anion transporter [Vitiosangium sp. GDMCC 1.1324]PTL82577.1 sodium-independent anion transporter [Vitiosangium sp. GDMCC 1.1324]
MSQRGTTTDRRSSFIPFLASMRGYRPSWLKRDLVGALTITALLIPEGMAYAQLAGAPPQAAFYACPVALVLYALLGSSRQLVVAVSATVAVLSAATISALAPSGSAHFLALTAGLAMLAGLISLLAGVLRLGRIAQFFSPSVLTGFVFGLALVIAIKQVPKLFGLKGAEGGFFERLWFVLTHLPRTHLPTLLVGASCLVLLVVLERISERLPAALVVLVLAILASHLLGLQARGVEVVGNIPSGLVAPRLPGMKWSDVLTLLPGACGIALVAFAEAIGPARMLGARHGYPVNPNQELIGLGCANLGAGLFQGFSVGCSLSKSAANDQAGAHSQLSSLVAAGFTLLVALFFTPLFRALPEATLGAIVVVAVSGMMEVGELRRLSRLRRVDFLVSMTALLGVLVLDVLPGLLLAVGLSLFLTVYRASLPRLSELGRAAGTLDFVDMRHDPSARSLPGLKVLRPNEGIFFANAESLREEILEHVRRGPLSVQAVLLDLEVTTDLDVPGADMLAGLHEELESRGVTLMLARAIAPTQEMMERTGVLEKVGRDHLYPHVLGGVVDYLARHAPHARDERAFFHDGLHRLGTLAEEVEASMPDEEREQLERMRRELRQAESALEEPPHGGSGP